MKKYIAYILIIISLFFSSSCSEVSKKVTKEISEVVTESGVRKLGKEVIEEGTEQTAKSAFANRIKSSSLKLAGKRLLITSKNQFISMAVYKKWLSSPENVSTLIIGQPKSGSILRENMKKVMGKKYKYAAKGNNQAHHIVGDNPESAVAKRILEKFGIDINDPINGILLPENTAALLKGTNHSGGHTKEYFNAVNNRLLNAKNRDQCMEILDDIKNDLYQGKLRLYSENVHKVNTVGSSFK